MPRPPKPPAYLRHVGADGKVRARVRINGRDVPLGAYGSPESYEKYEQELARWRALQAGGREAVPDAPVKTVAHLVARFLAHAEADWREPDGSPRKELGNYAWSLAPLVRVHGSGSVNGFGPKQLRALRQVMASGSWLTEEDRERRLKQGGHSARFQWSRRYINRAITRIKAVFGWGVSEELIPASTYHALLPIKGLRHRELAGVRELARIKPVPEDALEATLPHLQPMHRAMVMTQLLTGARPGEVCRLRPRDLQRTDSVEVEGVRIETAGLWAMVLDPEEDPDARHKTAYLGHRRIVLFGPQAQELLKPYLDGRDLDAPIFSPREAVAAWLAEKRRNRKTRVQPSQVSRARPSPAKTAGERFTSRAYAQAITRAIGRASQAATAAGQPPVPHWHPNQLRHNAATRLVGQFGWDVARIILGHRHVRTTQIYAVDDLKKAIEAIKRAG